MKSDSEDMEEEGEEEVEGIKEEIPVVLPESTAHEGTGYCVVV